MRFQQAKGIYLELKAIFNTKLNLIHPGHLVQGEIRVHGIDYKKELEDLPALGVRVEALVVELIEAYHARPVLGKYVLDLFQLTEHCIKLTWDIYKSRSGLRKNFISNRGNKYRFAFECLYYLFQFRLFLQYHLVKEKIRQDPVLLQYKAPEDHFSDPPSAPDPSVNIPLPYRIALLEQLGVFDLPAMKQLPQKRQREIIRLLIGGSDRQIKGNIAVLNPSSNEDRIRYTAYNYQQKARKLLMN